MLSNVSIVNRVQDLSAAAWNVLGPERVGRFS